MCVRVLEEFLPVFNCQKKTFFQLVFTALMYLLLLASAHAAGLVVSLI